MVEEKVNGGRVVRKISKEERGYGLERGGGSGGE